MKKLLSALLLACIAMPALAQVPVVSPTAMEPHWGYFRLSPCAAGNADLCGDNPPTWHIPVAACGVVLSTSAARNSDGSASTAGVRYTLPTVAELTAAGYTPSGADGSQTYNRQGQCEISFVMGLPLPGNYLRIGIDGVQNSDKVTFVYDGTFHDMFYGDVVFTPVGSASLTVAWNGTSWLAKAGTPNMMEQLGYGQTAAHGQGRLFIVTADPTWWTVDSRIGQLAYCPNSGRGTVASNNGGMGLLLIPSTCTFLEKAADTTQTLWVTLRKIGSTNITAISAGAAYGAGTAPDGTAFGAGNYAVLTGAFLASGMFSGNTV